MSCFYAAWSLEMYRFCKGTNPHHPNITHRPQMLTLIYLLII